MGPAGTSTFDITIAPLNTIASGTNQTVCINSAITNISLATTGATGATFTGLPAGVTGSWSADVVTISGTPTVSGVFNYTVTTNRMSTSDNKWNNYSNTVKYNSIRVPIKRFV